MTEFQENILKRIRDLGTEERIRSKASEPLWRLLFPTNRDLVMDRPEPKDVPDKI